MPAQREAPPIDGKQFWQAISHRATGSTIVAACSADGPAGFLGLSATHVCADPPTMLVCVDKRTSALPTILNARHFALSYLAREAVALADVFAGKSEIKATHRFEISAWTTLITGAPVLESAVGAIDCTLVETIERSNVTILLGRVVATRGDPHLLPLVHFRGGFLS